MKKAILSIAILFSLSAGAQVKDSTIKDTVYVLSKAQMQVIQKLLLQNSVVLDSKPVSAGDVFAFLNDLMRNARIVNVPKKEQPK